MSVILKYVLDFPDAFTVSNDAFSGDFIIDADIRAELHMGTAGGHFELKLYDLPEQNAGALYGRVRNPNEARVVIQLGYMDGDFGTVMEGIYSKVVSQVDGDKLVTTITGLETGTHALRKTRFQINVPGKVQIQEAVNKLLAQAVITEGEIAKEAECENVSKEEVQDIVLYGQNLMEILDKIAGKGQAELLVGDKRVCIGRPISDVRYEPNEFDRDVNLAVFCPSRTQLPTEEGNNLLEKLPPHEVQRFKFIVAGDPRLRPAQNVFANVVVNVDGKEEGYREKDKVDFRINWLVHSLTMAGGYVCEGEALRACSDGNCRRQQDTAGRSSADAAVRSLAQRIKDEPRRCPAIEVGQVKEHKPGESNDTQHRSTLYFGQRFDPTETQPSIRAEVETNESQLLRNKPVVSPFAWHKCGLVVPVYPGMKALLSHNLNLPDDAIVSGFLWSEKPAIEPPKSQEGDWWLCLPINFDTSKPPADSTKAANDLITNKGKRVIEVKGLKITVGSQKLSNVGQRPSDDGLEDDEVVIDHSKARIKIARDGSIEMTADVNGGVVFKIGRTSVEIS